MTSRRPLLIDGDAFQVGVPAIDGQHRELFEDLAAFEDAVRGQQPDDVCQMLWERLSDRLRRHAEYEEGFLTANRYRQIEAHRQDHVALGEAVDGLRRTGEDAAQRAAWASAIVAFEDVLLRHIVQHDLEYKWSLSDQGVIAPTLRLR